MSGGKGGSGGGAGPMLEYSEKALGLQKQMYDDAMTRSQPYSDAGQSALYELMTRMGVGGGKLDFKPPQTAVGVGGSDWDYANIGGDAQYANQAGTEQWRKDPATGQWYVRNESGGLSDKSVSGWSEQADPINPIDETRSDYGSLLTPFGMEQYQADPGYQFRLSEGNKALERALASRGKFSSMNPEAAKALTGYGQEMASQEYGNAYNRYNTDQGNIFNRLSAITGMGQVENNSMAQTGANYANQASNLYTGMGNAITAANQAKQANKGSMFNTLLGAGAQLGAAYLTGGGSSLFSGASSGVPALTGQIGGSAGSGLGGLSFAGW